MHRGQHAVAFEFRRVFSRRATQLGWQAELQRWAATQLSAAHPNHEHIALLWNVQSQRCASLDDAFRAADELVKLPMEVVKTRPMCVKTEELRGRMSTVDEFAGILADDHGALPRVDRSMTPVLWSKAKRPPEFAMYANHPLVKGLIRHTAAQFRQVETLFGLREAAKPAETGGSNGSLGDMKSIGSLGDMKSIGSFGSSASSASSASSGSSGSTVAAIRTLDKIREILSLSKNRYYFGGMTNWPIYEGILAELHRAMTLMSLVMEHSFPVSPELSFSLDDPIFDVPNSIFDQSVDLGVSNRLLLRISNLQPVPRGKIISIPVIDMHFCIYDKSGRILPFQLTPDFETPFFLSFEASIPAGSSRFYQLRRCNAYLDSQAKRIPRDSSREQRFGTPEFGVILSPDGSFKGVEVNGTQVAFGASLGFFIGSDKRVVRSGL